MEIKSLEKTDFDTLFRAFGRAFADYEVQPVSYTHLTLPTTNFV